MSMKILVSSAIIILSIVAVVLTSLIVINEYSEFLRTTTVTNAQGLVTGKAGVATLMGSSGQYPFTTTITGCSNSSNAVALNPANYTVTAGDENGGWLTLSASAGDQWNSTTINCTALTYKADSVGQGAADDLATALAIFATMMAVVSLAILGTVVINTFKKV